MATEPEKRPTVTLTQFELWLNNPVTKVYLNTLEQRLFDEETAAGTGKLVDSSNADMTHAMIHRSLGVQDGLQQARNPERLMSGLNRIDYPEDPEPDADA